MATIDVMWTLKITIDFLRGWNKKKEKKKNKFDRQKWKRKRKKARTFKMMGHHVLFN